MADREALEAAVEMLAEHFRAMMEMFFRATADSPDTPKESE